ncbi:C4-dicarboxylate ABC transporter substrate-binding protein [Rhodobacteraceae bacterium RKSG542]|uniref:TRAP transporter substrate-binding protein DctP n=1 Tax=Pseudovibrio flavus TaxID=2529854 RepID=UPI0012BBE8AC|nr:TRAP transporter substrate-binding protein DctP [Pseudovibrio flavus]MTI18008.1 C4-dicarboxylate ABC transporter substrate-binding protein [Pseudovibrio flavus]
MNKFAATLALGAALVSAPLCASAETYSFKFTSANFAGEQVFDIQKEWSDKIADASRGRFQIDLLPLDSVVKPADSVQAVRNNIIQGGMLTSAHFAGMDKGFGLIGDTLGAWDSDEDILKFYYAGGGFEIVDEIFQEQGVKLIGVSLTGAESIPSKVKIEKVEDFKGVKVRAPSGPVQNLFEAMGATPVNLPGSEIYSGLDKGIIDAADFSTFSNNQQQGVNDIAKYPIYPGIHSSPTVHIFMNLKIWNSLDEQDQTFLLTYFRGMALDTLIRPHLDDEIAYKKAVAEGATPVAWSAEEKAKVRELAKTVWEKTAAESEIGRRYLDALLAHLEARGK